MLKLTYEKIFKFVFNISCTNGISSGKGLRFVQISDARFLSSAENDGLKKLSMM